MIETAYALKGWKIEPDAPRLHRPTEVRVEMVWFWDTGNGDIANQGAHEMDIARWGLGRDDYPQSVFSTGGKFAYDDDPEIPNTQVAALDFGDAQILF
mgnify:CR=1 FL=1